MDADGRDAALDSVAGSEATTRVEGGCASDEIGPANRRDALREGVGAADADHDARMGAARATTSDAPAAAAGPAVSVSATPAPSAVSLAPTEPPMPLTASTLTAPTSTLLERGDISSPPSPPSPPPPPPPPTLASPTSTPAVAAAPRPRAVSEWTPRREHTLPPLPPPPVPTVPTAPTAPTAPGRPGLLLRPRPHEVVLPRWQPDAEVTYCPICRTQFSIFVRKHHCRKCGRVVCNSCSPHRITIPYQYIVHPPGPYPFGTPAAAAAALLLGDGGGGGGAGSGSGSGSSGYDSTLVDVSTLGGGERVRLCNPCVPDPNTAPPHTPGGLPASGASSPGGRAHYRSASTASSAAGGGGSGGGGGGLSRTTFLGMPATSAAATALAAASAPASSSSARHHRLSLPPGSHADGRRPEAAARQQLRHQQQQQHQHQQQHQPHPHRPRPLPLAEEDECPVCHLELPSRQLPHFEEQREQHIIACLESHSIGPHSNGRRRAASSSEGGGAGGGIHAVGGGSSGGSGSSSYDGGRTTTSTATTTATPDHFRLPPLPAPTHPWRTGLFPYRATEKDCVDAAECTICLEEFEVGVPMARLECLCRFHRACILAWFDKHPGRCPVHNHDSADY